MRNRLRWVWPSWIRDKLALERFHNAVKMSNKEWHSVKLHFESTRCVTCQIIARVKTKDNDNKIFQLSFSFKPFLSLGTELPKATMELNLSICKIGVSSCHISLTEMPPLYSVSPWVMSVSGTYLINTEALQPALWDGTKRAFELNANVTTQADLYLRN